MKKTFLTIAIAVVCALGMSSCGDDISDILGGTDALGHITFTASNPIGEQLVEEGQEFDFKSSLCNVSFDSIHMSFSFNGQGVDTVVNDLSIGTILLGVYGDQITENTSNIQFPMVGINLRDTVPGEYVFHFDIDDWQFVRYIDTTNFYTMIRTGWAMTPEIGNLFGMAESRNALYIAYDGAINITSFGSEGKRIKGSINNVKCIYVTLDKLEALHNMTEAEREAVDIENYFSKVTFNGEISSKRTEISTILHAIEDANS
jgi:hypothetical protein